METPKTLGNKVGYKNPPKNRQFGQPDGNPRGHGFFKKEDTARYKLEQMMKMTEDELVVILKDKKRPYIERKLAEAINKGTWKEMKEMFDQVYGYPKQDIEQTNIEMPAPRLARDRSEKK